MEKMLQEKRKALATTPPIQRKEVDYYKMIPLMCE
jgi:hypothetical protein